MLLNFISFFKELEKVTLDPLQFWTDEMSVKLTVRLRRCQEVKMTLGQTFSDGHVHWVWCKIHPTKEIELFNVPKDLKSRVIEDFREKGNICLVVRPIYFSRSHMTQIPSWFWDQSDYFRVWVTLNRNTGKSWYVKAITQIREQPDNDA